MIEDTDEFGRIQKLPYHDGYLNSVNILGENKIEIGLRSVEGMAVLIVLSGVRYFSMNNFLESNIIDTVYLWRIGNVPPERLRDASTIFEVEESFFDKKNSLNSDKLFVLESSYGATVYALVNRVMRK